MEPDPPEDPFEVVYDPFSHPLVWCLQDALQNKPSNFEAGKEPGALSGEELGSSFARSHEHQMALKIVEQRRRVPPVLNDRALFTKAAPFGDRGDQSYHAPSNRIGVNYSPASMAAAAALFEEVPQDPHSRSGRFVRPATVAVGSNGSMQHTGPHSPGATGHGAAGAAGRATLVATQTAQPAGSAPQHAGVTSDGGEASLVDAVLRYHYHAELGIDARAVAPFREEWMDRALALVPAGPPPLVSQDFYDDLIASSSEEVRSEYNAAVKKAILDYVIASPVERERLNLNALQPLLSMPSASKRRRTAAIRRKLPGDWRTHVEAAREEIAWTLQTLSPNALELSRLWIEGGYGGALLVELEGRALLGRLPAQAEWFRQFQSSRCEGLKAQLWTHWMPKSVDVFRRLSPVFINGDADAFYRSIATLQSIQLRDLVSRSMDALLKFFRQHPGIAPADVQGGEVHWCAPPVFETELVISDAGHITFQPSFQESEAAVLSTLDALVAAVAGIPRLGPHSTSSGSAVAPPPPSGSSAAAAAAAGGGGSSGNAIPSTGLYEEAVVAARRELRSLLSANTAAPMQLAALFGPHLAFVVTDPEGTARAFAASKPSLAQYAEEVARLRAAAAAIRTVCTDNVRTGLYIVRCHALKERLAAAAEECAMALLELVCADVRESNLRIYDECQAMAIELGKPCRSGEEVLALKRFIQKCNGDAERVKEAIATNKSRDEFLYVHRFPVPEEDFDSGRRAYEWPRKLADALREAVTKANSEHREFEGALKRRRKEFAERVDAAATAVAACEGRTEITKRDAIAVEVTELGGKLAAAVQEAEEINGQEKMFGWAPTKYGHVNKLAATLEPYVVLWTTLSSFYDKWASWMNGPFTRLNPEEVESEASDAFRKLYKLTKTFAGSAGIEAREGPLAVAEEGRAKVVAFQAHVPLLQAICNPGLRERHWTALADMVGFEIKRDEVTSLRRLLDNDIGEHLSKISELSDSASREYSIERALDKMSADWEGLAFQMGEWKATGTYVLKGGPVDEAQMLLDDHIVKSQAMAASPFSKPFEERLVPWEAKLRRFQDILDEWLKCQGKWLYLEPIFGAEEIMKQIPVEGNAFREMDSAWRTIMSAVKEDPLMIHVADTPGLLEALLACNAKLDVVEKGLNDFLDTKKMAFPRFYFLSNDELLEILAEAKDPLAVQPFVKKCFEAVKELVFEPRTATAATAGVAGDAGVIKGLVSVEGEKIPFVQEVDPSASGAVEVWLLAVENAIKRTLHSLAGDALAAYAKGPRSSWILQWPGQLVLNCSQVFWTREVTDAIHAGGSKGLAAYASKCTLELNKIVGLVRGQLTALERATCGALVVIDVHARDVTTSMAAAGVSDVRDFSWESQMRYSWEHHEAPPSGTGPQETLVVRMINAEALYGYEYLGNSGRLVITPLTDRCYRTLMGAIHMNLGGAPAGPAGTGKTETTKDLSKALAIQCVVFNCSDGLDYKAMGKFFKGLACCGAWACFDEFNRIELEVLSVVAQQVLTIIRAKAAKVKTFIFEGIEISLKPTCNVFITMNPGYAGRSELPDNLKALFRDVAMMVPDYGMISEIMLYSYGYLDARAMARKLVQTYRLCSEQLSSQDHYDYGMRAVMSVLRAAGNLKRSFPEQQEDVLMLRAINDVNLPKFLDQDVPLFRGILSDLFPGVELPVVDYDNLRAALIDNCLKAGLQPLESFLIKAIQLYEMIVVRHGLMLVGQSYGMKTSAYRMLAAALTDLNAQGLNGEFATKVYCLNPKSVTMGQLYGQEDAVSKEWTDGVLPVLFRAAARDTSPDRKWIVFDGPVDAIWIENMNTVLDDNKKLCLNSGEIIAMQGLMNMIFEVADLAVASPATVSRCGMVYVQPDLLGWRPVLQSWLAKLPAGVNESQRVEITALFDWLLPPLLRLALRGVKAPLPMQDINLAVSCMRLMESHLDEFRDGSEALAELPPERQSALLQAHFLFSLVWSVGANTDEEGRRRFDTAIRKLLASEAPAELAAWVKAPAVKVVVPFPEGTALVYDYVLDRSRIKWQPWMDTLESRALDLEADYSSIIVPTVDTLRYSYLLDKLAMHNYHALFVGPTGTGKTAYIKRYLQQRLPPASFSTTLLTFSAQTSVNMTQDIIDARLDKRRRGVYGPPQGKSMVVFVDDLNMPQVEEYGAQPPIELLRQWMDHGGWYDRKELTLRKLESLQYVAAMGPPGGGRNSVTNRFLRHFSVVGVAAFDRDNLQIIFSSLVDWWLRKHSYGSNIARLAKPLVGATLDVYEGVQAALLPTPAKSHYTFNLRDVSKVFQGITKAGGSVEDVPTMVRLWTHEVLRVFYDRLVSDDDRLWTGRLLERLTEEHFKERLGKLLGAAGDGDADLLAGLRSLVFGDFMVPGADARVYRDITDSSKLLAVITEYLGDLNATSKTPLNLVLFQFALEHVSRLARIITSPGGNALLVGLGGSGRQSLTRLAAFIEEHEVFQVEISKNYGKAEWHDDIRKVLRMAGEANKKVVFLFSDTQIRSESFVEDISNLLNTGEVPNLMGAGDLATIFENMRPRAKQAGMDGTKDSMYEFFVQEVRRNLHIVLSFSPVGDAFRDRLRKFPSLVNCTTIDWFTPWPKDALASVATSFLAGLPGVSEGVVAALPQLCVLFHESVKALAGRFLAEQKRHYYVTPTSYLELLGSYKKLLGKRQDELMTAKRRYEVGLEKLATTEESVQGMQEELIALQPQLEESTRQTEAAMVVIAHESAEADKVKQVVSVEEAAASAEAAKVKAIKDECESDLAEALPALEAALKALDTLTKNDITEVKGMKSPPAGVKLVLEAVCILKGIKPVRMKDPGSGQMVDNYWEASKKMLMEDDFLGSLRQYDKDHIEPSIMKRITPYIGNPDFQPEKILQASKAAYGLCCWARAMESYDRVAKVVEPKRQRLAEAEGQLSQVMAALRSKQAELAEVMRKLAELDADLRGKKKRKESLEAEVELCKVKLDRAVKLIAGLGGEKSRWTAAAAALGDSYSQLVGDVLLAAAQIAYLGPFTSTYRADCLASWVEAARAAAVPCGERFRLGAVLGDPVKIRQWAIWGLPRDDFSIENAIAVDQGRRWPLMIDPQGSANKWVRNMERDRGLLVIKLSDAGYVRTLENAIQFGKPVLLENVGETLDATLEPLLARCTFKQGGALCIKLGDAVVEYSEEFSFYITTKLRNPHYAPELCTKVSLLNFAVTREGLEDQLLGIVVAAERPDLEEEKNRLIVQGAANKRKLKETEDEILRVLSASSGNILEDEGAVRVLNSAKILADEIAAKQRIADETEEKIDVARAGYKPVAHHSSLLYFCVTDMGAIDPMYQYSLRWFLDLFVRAIADSTPSQELSERLQLLNDHFTFFLYMNVCRSLFEKDKLLFAFLLVSRLNLDSASISPAELRFLLTGGVAVGEAPLPNPAPEWLSDKAWGEMCRASDLGPSWEGLAAHVAGNTNAWRAIYDSLEPQSAQLPSPWTGRLDSFQRLMLLRALRPDKLIPAITAYVSDSMGKRFVEPQPFAIEPSFNDSTATKPLIFVLSAGSDPMAALLKFAEDKGTRVESVSLGQGQGPVAQRWIDEGSQQGFWVVLQNCHLAKSFLPTLELICESQLVEGRVHPNFRLWLTSYPSPLFPMSLLENGIKMTNEPPKGLRAGLLRTYTSDPICTPEFFEGCSRDAPFKALLFGLAFFHSVVQERRKFGPIGWNIPYEFNENDLRISVRQLRIFLDEYPDIPYDTLCYTCGECNYGGRVTDGHDRHTLMTLLGCYYTPELVAQEQCKLSGSGTYFVPPSGDHKSYLDYVNSLPLIAAPEVFGLHDNADITKDLQETTSLLEGLLSTQGRSGALAAPAAPAAAKGAAAPGAAAAAAVVRGPEAVIADVAADILARLPANFDVEATEAAYPQDYFNSMNTVLVQELGRFNVLLSSIRSSLIALGQAVKGLALMSDELDAVGRSLFDGKVPALWLRRSFPSLKPLGSYIKEVLERVTFFSDWIARGPPPVFWISGFFFIQAFLTGAKQNYARKVRAPIDQIDFDFEVRDSAEDTAAASATDVYACGIAPPEDGVYCRGLYLEGCRWDAEAHELGESEPKVLYTPLPLIWMVPKDTSSFTAYPNYNCPMYKTTERRGVLSTTGHSTNFVLDVRLPTKKPAEHWTRRGVALLTSLND